jgi:glycosyltransferase involved in cell wall biosynthesis
MTPTVSVLLTSYNRERYIGASIESVLAQTFEDFELIVVDDRSSDASVAVARAYAQRDKRVRVFENTTNLGDYPNRNHAASLAEGRFLRYHDSDDLMYPQCLATLVAALEAEPRASFALSTAWAWPGGPCPMLSTPRMSYQREFLGRGMFMCGPSCALFRREPFLRAKGFPTSGPHSDFLFWLRFCRTESALLMPADLFWYRIHSGQHLQGTDAAWDSVPLARAAWEALNASDCPLIGEEREQAKRNQAFNVVKQVYRDLRRWQPQLAIHRARQSGLSLAEWSKYLRRPQRSSLAGTPLTADGDYVIPDSARDPVGRTLA